VTRITEKGVTGGSEVPGEARRGKKEGDRRMKVGKSVLLLLVMVLLLGLVSLAGSAAKVTLRMGTWQADDPAFGPFYKEAIAAFEKENPEIEIVLEHSPSAAYWDKLLTQIATKNAPDIMKFAGYNFHEYVAMGALEPLDEYLAKTDILKRWYPVQKTFPVVNGKTYAVILMQRGTAVYYNKRMLQEAGLQVPKDLKEFVEAARKLTKRQGGEIVQYGLGLRTDPKHQDVNEYTLLFVLAHGAHWTDNGKWKLTDPKVVKAVQYVKDLYDAGVSPLSAQPNLLRELFWQEKLAMHIDGPWYWAQIEKGNPGMVKDVGTFLLPAAAGGSAVSTGGPMNLIGVSRNAKHKEEAWKFIAFISRPEWQNKFTDYSFNTGGMKGSVTPQFLKTNPWFSTFADAVDVAKQIPPPGFETRYTPFRKAVNSALGEIFILNRPVRESLKVVQDQMEQLANR
jgi:multiple sugar transport system substrate-binding protein